MKATLPVCVRYPLIGLAMLTVCSAAAQGSGWQDAEIRDSVSSEYYLGDASWVEGKSAEALAHFRKVLSLAPEHVSAMVDAAWLLSCAPEEGLRNPKEAIVLARRATELTHAQNAHTLDVLAAAYAADGTFDLAVETAEQALRLHPREAIAAAIRSRQEIYRRREAFIVLDPR